MRTKISIDNKSFEDIRKIDEEYIGTDKYIGFAYFWNYDYRHYLRYTTDYKRRLIHNRFIKNNLNLAGTSKKHLEIIKEVLKWIKQMKTMSIGLNVPQMNGQLTMIGKVII